MQQAIPQIHSHFDIQMMPLLCGTCGVPYALATAMVQSSHGWCCPNGHPHQVEQAAPLEEIKLLREHVASHALGTCPYCQERFRRLDRHLAWKHLEEQGRKAPIPPRGRAREAYEARKG